MANDVTIVVEADLGDTLLKLELAKLAVDHLGDSGGVVGRKLGDDTDRNSFSSRIANLRSKLSSLGDGRSGPLGLITKGFGNLASAILDPLQLSAQLGENFGRVGTIAGTLVGGIASLATAWVGLAATIAAVTFAATALADILGTLVAIAADLVAPVTLVAGLLGGLGLAFGIAAKRAADGGGKLSEFSKKLDMLKSMFGRTSDILAHAFLPYLLELAGAAQKALNFLDKIVKLPLRQAFHAIDTQGMHMLRQFVDRVAEVLAKPIRLAFHVAFDDKNFAGMVQDWWHRFTGFLFGETESHPIKLHKKTIGFESHAVDGIFQPLVDWFNRHHFTRQGIQIGRQILNGVLNSGMKKRIVDFISQVFHDSGTRALHAFWNALNQPLLPLLEGLWHTIDQQVNAAGHRWRQSIISSMQSAWNAVLNFVSNIWSRIVAFITHPISINIDWPSPPSWLSHLPGSGIVSSITGAVGGALGGHTAGAGDSVARFRPRAAMAAAPNVYVTIHGADLSDAATRKRIAQKLGKELVSDWSRRAGGH